jgi:hypothetical protein
MERSDREIVVRGDDPSKAARLAAGWFAGMTPVVTTSGAA